jgi:Fe-S-cluster-containing dehydrogenase component
MRELNRRNWLKSTLAISAASALSTKKLNSADTEGNPNDHFGVLVDTTVCIGCRNCEWACKSAHDMPTDGFNEYKDREVFKEFRRPDSGALTVVNEYENKVNPLLPIDVKVQCMHCDHPSCASACIVGAFKKQKNGAVTWDTDKCIGCRYCMVACPFQVPTFDYDKALNPEIRKCDFCYKRTAKGELPACVNICPVEALTYGNKPFLIKEARDRIKRNPDRYNEKIFGEYDAGGTSWMYLASKDFYELGFPKVSTKPAPGTTEAIQHGIFAYFVPPIALYSMLGGLMWYTNRKNSLDEGDK